MKSYRPIVEILERRIVLSSIAGHPSDDALDARGRYTPVVMAGILPDSPAARAAAADSDHRLDGVGSLFLRKGNGPVGALCTATPIRTAVHPTVTNFLLTAGHCVDSNDDGIADYNPDRVTFYPDGNTSAGVAAKRLVAHPDFQGFINNIFDDIAVVELAAHLPNITPIYDLVVGSSIGTTVTLAGFGGSGNGDVDSTVNASLTVKRSGQNVIDQIFDGGELWKADFDHPTNTGLNQMGGGSLDNTVETIQVQGDSGGPIFYDDDGTLKIAGTMTFGEDTAAAAFPKFGSLAGGMIISSAYVDWIDSVIDGGGVGVGGGGGGKPCNPKKPGCTAGMSHVDAEIVLAIDMVASSRFSGQALSDASSSRDTSPATGSNFNQEAGRVVAREIVATADVSSGSRESRRAPASDDSVDLQFEVWPGSLQELFGDELLSF
jgi:hypothetical protein